MIILLQFQFQLLFQFTLDVSILELLVESKLATFGDYFLAYSQLGKFTLGVGLINCLLFKSCHVIDFYLLINRSTINLSISNLSNFGKVNKYLKKIAGTCE